MHTSQKKSYQAFVFILWYLKNGSWRLPRLPGVASGNNDVRGKGGKRNVTYLCFHSSILPINYEKGVNKKNFVIQVLSLKRPRPIVYLIFFFIKEIKQKVSFRSGGEALARLGHYKF